MSVVEGQMRAGGHAGHMCKVRPHRDLALTVAHMPMVCHDTDHMFIDASDPVIDAVRQSDRVIEIKLP